MTQRVLIFFYSVMGGAWATGGAPWDAGSASGRSPPPRAGGALSWRGG